ncbi:MAG: hypothetical protein AAFR79_09545 [Pseudomonadota bacterium]
MARAPFGLVIVVLLVISLGAIAFLADIQSLSDLKRVFDTR